MLSPVTLITAMVVALEAALGSFTGAVAAGPGRDDLGRVLFYLGFTLKELERFAYAIVELERAVSAPQVPEQHTFAFEVMTSMFPTT